MTTLWMIEGEPLSGVCFVQDYVEFHFDGRILRALSHPAVANGSIALVFPEDGCRDALCSLIGVVVSRIDVVERDKIELIFGNGYVLTVPLDDVSRVGPESAHFAPGDNKPIEVW